jgi:hypothetical protein
VRWRVGRHLSRTLYVQVRPEPSDADLFVGIMDSPEAARQVVDAMNLISAMAWADDPDASDRTDGLHCTDADRP